MILSRTTERRAHMPIVIDYLTRFPFYRCNTKDGGCHRLTTELELSKDKECRCGNSTFRPTNLYWYENLYPRVLEMAWARFVTQEIIVNESTDTGMDCTGV
jgi:hypothetical protein